MRNLPSDYRAKASGDSNSPIELYDIFLDTETLHFAKYDTNFTFFDLAGNSQVYTAFPIQREPARKASDMSIGMVTVKVANVDRSMSAYLAETDFRGRRVTIRKVFTDLVTSSGDAVLVFDGVMDSPIVGEEVVQFEAGDRITLNRMVPRQRFMLLCNHKFGNDDCFRARLSGDMYGTYRGSVTSTSSASRIYDSVLSSGDDFFKDGEVVFTSGQNANKKRKITTNVASSYFEVDTPLSNTPVSGDTFTLRRNCDKTWFRCSGDFNNDANFLGFPTIPAELVVR